MNEALILEKLEQLSAEVKSLKSDVLQDIRHDLEPLLKKAQPELGTFLADIEDGYSNEKAVHLAKNVLNSLDELNEMVDIIKSGVDFKNDLMPIAKQAYPSTVGLFKELEGEYHGGEISLLLRKIVTNLENLGEAIDMLKAGVELRDDLIPVVRLLYPRILRFMNSLHEGEFQAEKLGDLLQTILFNIHTLSDLLNMAQPMTEFVKEVTVIMQRSDVIDSINIWLDSVQQSSGMIKLGTTLWAQAKEINYSPEQIEEICAAIADIDLNKVEPVGPFGMVRQLKDPKVQSALGFIFMMLQTMGTVLQAAGKKSQQTEQQ